MAVPGNYFQKKEGVEDGVERMAEDMLVGGDRAGDPALVEVICKGAYDAMEWLVWEGGVAWQPYSVFSAAIPFHVPSSPKETKEAESSCRLPKGRKLRKASRSAAT